MLCPPTHGIPHNMFRSLHLRPQLGRLALNTSTTLNGSIASFRSPTLKAHRYEVGGSATI